MKLNSIKILLLSVLISSGVYAQSTSATLIKKVEGFSHPESVVFNEAKNEYYISNMADNEAGDGFISRVSAEGEIIELKWIDGLKDPKGLLVKDDKVYVTNNTEVIEISIDKSEEDAITIIDNVVDGVNKDTVNISSRCIQTNIETGVQPNEMNFDR